MSIKESLYLMFELAYHKKMTKAYIIVGKAISRIPIISIHRKVLILCWANIHALYHMYTFEAYGKYLEQQLED